jgi:hypothetical protein
MVLLPKSLNTYTEHQATEDCRRCSVLHQPSRGCERHPTVGHGEPPMREAQGRRCRRRHLTRTWPLSVGRIQRGAEAVLLPLGAAGCTNHNWVVPQAPSQSGWASRLSPTSSAASRESCGRLPLPLLLPPWLGQWAALATGLPAPSVLHPAPRNKNSRGPWAMSSGDHMRIKMSASLRLKFGVLLSSKRHNPRSRYEPNRLATSSQSPDRAPDTNNKQ